jgi:alkaline phosphatase
MARYVDGYLLVVPKGKLALYRRMAATGAKVWKKHGALEYRECVGDDLKGMKGLRRFTEAAKAKAGETVVFSWVVYRSKAHRDRVNGKVMTDPALQKMMHSPMPFDMKRMCFGGFRVLVEA